MNSSADSLAVVQEVAVARAAVVCFGMQTVLWNKMYYAAWVHHSCFEDFHIGTHLSGGDRIFLDRLALLISNIESYFPNSRYLSAKEDHDRIFAVRALANVRNIDVLRPDYDVSLSELWVRTTIFILTTPN